LALEAQERPDEAGGALSLAFSLARPEGYARIFLDLGQSLCELLARLAAQGTMPEPTDTAIARISGDYVRDLLDAFQQEIGRQRSHMAEAISMRSALAEAPLDPLTERELEVLQLLAEGLTNKQIAGRLVVAPSTVKQHLKNIYGKLDVHSRTQAVARGRELALL
jgi:LuxR family maltose regulon positive regulatory protein